MFNAILYHLNCCFLNEKKNILSKKKKKVLNEKCVLKASGYVRFALEVRFGIYIIIMNSSETCN